MKTLNLLFNKNIAAVVLCGGNSRRFDFKDKALLKYDNNSTFLEHIISECSNEELYLSVNNSDKYNSLISDYKEKHNKKIYIIEDINKNIGALGGIHSAFVNINSNYIQFLSCDTPNINRDFLYYMQSMADEYHDAFIPVYNDKAYFLCGIYSKNIINAVNENIQNKEYRIKKLIEKIKVKYIDLKYTIFQLHNINTLDDYLLFQKTIPQYFAICGKRNSGKTTLICKLIKEFVNMGKSVAVIKHTSHDHSFDTVGKDTYDFKNNGASATLIYSPLKYMLVKDYIKSEDEKDDLIKFIKSLNEYDIIILEGFKHIDNIPKIEMFRKDITDKPLCEISSLKALVTNDINYKSEVPVLDINNISSIIDFITQNLIII